MSKICIVTWFGIRDTIESARKEFVAQGCEVCDYPHLELKYTGETLANHIMSTSADILLLWCLLFTADDIAAVKQQMPNIKIWVYNWDDPYQLMHRPDNSDYLQYIKYVDHIFTCSHVAVEEYKKMSINSTYLLPACPYAFVNPRYIYDYDVIFMIGNLYSSYETTVVSRIELVSNLIDANINVLLFGDETIFDRFPNNYGGFLSYQQVFTWLKDHRARIFLSTHVCISDGYLNERCSLILGSGNLLVTDTAEGTIHLPSDTFKLIAQNNAVSVIKSIIEKDKSSDEIDNIRQNGLAFAQTHLSYTSWVKTMLNQNKC
jgi:hypothetical protein